MGKTRSAARPTPAARRPHRFCATRAGRHRGGTGRADHSQGCDPGRPARLRAQGAASATGRKNTHCLGGTQGRLQGPVGG